MRAINTFAIAAVALTLAPAPFASVFAGSDPKGIWLDDTGRGAVEIKPCANTGDALCGNVVWVKSTGDTDGCGKQIMGDVMPVGQGRWDNGWIYSPEKGRKYDVELTPLSNGNLKVVGYAGLKFLSKTMIWTPAPQDLQLCNLVDPNKKPGSAAAPLPVTPNVDTTASRLHDKEAKTEDAAASVATTKPEAKSADAPSVTPPAPDKPETAAKTAPAGDSGNGPAGDPGKIKIGDLQLDKFLSKTKDGKCKLDLPWVKVTIDCDHERQ